MGSLRFRPDGRSDGVPFLEESINDVDGDETVRASDEDFASWNDGRHIPLVVEVWVKSGDLVDEFGEGTEDGGGSAFLPSGRTPSLVSIDLLVPSVDYQKMLGPSPIPKIYGT